MDNGRIEKEREFHNDRFSGEKDIRSVTHKYYSIVDSAKNHYITLIKKYCNNRLLLEYGCGTGNASDRLIDSNAIIQGIDISQEAVAKASENAARKGYNAEYRVMNAEELEYGDNHFNVVVGTGILHHLDLDRSYSEISRVLKTDGHAVFLEPLGHNPFINLYRFLTPKLRTEDEHPLLMKDIQLAKKYFNDVDVAYFNLLTFFAIPLRNTPLYKSIYRILQSLEGSLLKVIPFLKRYTWIVVIDMSNPIR